MLLIVADTVDSVVTCEVDVVAHQEEAEEEEAVEEDMVVLDIMEVAINTMVVKAKDRAKWKKMVNKKVVMLHHSVLADLIGDVVSAVDIVVVSVEDSVACTEAAEAEVL